MALAWVVLFSNGSGWGGSGLQAQGPRGSVCFAVFYSHNFTPPITTHHLAKLSLLLFKKKKKALLILESCLSEMLKIKTVCTSKDKYHLS